MSMAYNVWVVVFGFDADEEDEIISAVEDLGFDRTSVDGDDIAMEGNDELRVGHSTADFAETIAHSVWLANGSFCEVQVSAVCRDCTDGEQFYFDEDVERRVRNKLEEFENGEIVHDVRFADAKKEFLKQKENVNKQATADAYGYSLEAFQRLVKPNKLCKINEGTLEDFAAARKKEGMTPETCNKDLRACRALLWWCVRKKWLKEIPKFKNAWVREDRRKPVIVPKEEYETILANIGKVKLTKREAPWWSVATTLLFALGVRRGEIINSLKWENVNLDSPGSEELTIMSETSKGRRTRVLPLMPELVKMLREWRAANPDEVYVLPYPGDTRNLYSDWNRFAGGRVMKNGRSTTGSMMALANVPTVVIKDFLGHSSVTTTERYYTNTAPALRKAAEARAAG